MEIGTRIKQLRLERSVTQEALAQELRNEALCDE